MNEVGKIFIKILGEVYNTTITFNLRKSVVTKLFPTLETKEHCYMLGTSVPKNFLPLFILVAF